MKDMWDGAEDDAIREYGKAPETTLTEVLLFAVLAQLAKINYQLEVAAKKK